MKQITAFIDPFCGCGGSSMGLKRAGNRCLVVPDFNREVVATFRANLTDVVLLAEKVVKKDPL